MLLKNIGFSTSFQCVKTTEFFGYNTPQILTQSIVLIKEWRKIFRRKLLAITLACDVFNRFHLMKFFLMRCRNLVWWNLDVALLHEMQLKHCRYNIFHLKLNLCSRNFFLLCSSFFFSRKNPAFRTTCNELVEFNSFATIAEYFTNPLVSFLFIFIADWSR